jgi:aldehyde:ferredoxin oxidoreductase
MSRVPTGYTGKILRVDLTNEQITEEYPSEDILRLHIGGVGLGAKFLYSEVPPGVEWNDPENRLIFATGPVNGSKVAGSGSFCVVTKGPLTNGAASSQANGFFGAYLKFAGFDAIVFRGCAPRWLYLYIHNGTAELRDAEHLRGKDTLETEELVNAELGKTGREMSVYAVGPAGENLVKFACIVGDKGHVAAHNGVGAVMGSKRLKAVAIAQGKTAVVAKDKAKLSTLARKTLQDFKATPMYDWGTSGLYSMCYQGGMLPIKNLTTSTFPEFEKFTGPYYRSRFELIKRNPCLACPSHHCHIFKVTEGPYAGHTGEEPEYECLAAWGSLIGQTDVGAAFMLSDLSDRLGLETNESGWLIAFLMECFEKGLISQKETDGLQMNWGNVEAVKAMLYKIASRQGFGDLLAEGLMRTAQKLGGEALNIGVYVKKGHAPRGHDHRAEWNQMFDTATSNTGTIETGVLSVADHFSPEEVSGTVAKAKGKNIFVDSLVMCQFAANALLSPKIDHLVDMVNAITGWDMTPEEAMRSGVRTVNLLRAFNIRHGIGPQVEAPSTRYSSAPTDGPAKGKSIAPYWEQMLDNYYKEMGWDRMSGRPLPKTLQSLGLDYIVSDIW